jgi:hypothetical protein
MIAAVSADTVSSPAIITTAFSVGSSALARSVRIDGESNIPEVSIEDSEISSMDVQASSVFCDAEHWDSDKGRRFRELALRESLGTLSTEELADLELLTQLRRSEKYPRPADEILWHRRQRNVTRDLLHALRTYVEFHDTPRNS